MRVETPIKMPTPSVDGGRLGLGSWDSGGVCMGPRYGHSKGGKRSAEGGRG